jgi:hypothetical protein
MWPLVTELANYYEESNIHSLSHVFLELIPINNK